MKLIKFFIVLTFFLSCFKAFADEYTSKLNELMAKYDNIEMFSGVVLLAKDGSPVFEKSYGYADWESKTPNTTETLFNIGSINKMFTHSIIIQLQNEGKLNVNDPLNKYLSLYNEETGSKITIQMLLDMKAGLGDYLRDPNYFKNIEKFKTINDYLELIKNEPLLFEPGTDQRYSNSGYAVLGGIIEKVTGKSYVENLKERFFEPLGMTSSYYRQIGDNIRDAAIGTQITFSGKKINEPFNSMPSPAGGLFMTAGDLLKFDSEIRKSNLISAGVRAGGTQVWNTVLAQYKDGYTLIIVSNFRLMAEEVEKRFNKILQGKQYPEPDVLPEMKFYKLLKDGGAAALEKSFKQILEDAHMEYNDMHLNIFGYGLMENGEIDMAIEVFKLNTKLFPGVPNVWDSLGEAYMNKGNKELAIANYKKVLELAPENENAKKMIEKLNK